MIRDKIEEKLVKEYNPIFLKVYNESHLHNTPKGSETHFRIVIVSEKFVNMRFLNRHRAIYNILNEELSNSIHALALRIFSLREWENIQKNTVLKSPNCYKIFN